MPEPLDVAEVFTEEEIDWIYEHGGYIYDYTQDAVDEQTSSQADDFYTLSGDVTSQIDDVFSIVEDDDASLWDTIWGWVTGGYEWVRDKAVDAWETARDWVSGYTEREAWENALLMDDIAASLDRTTAEEKQSGGSIEWGITASLDEDTYQAADRNWWDNLAIDFPEFSLEPLAGILGRLADNIADRINGFIANSLGIKYKR